MRQLALLVREQVEAALADCGLEIAAGLLVARRARLDERVTQRLVEGVDVEDWTVW